jgi:fructose-specific phosphotransferase system IIC component
MDYERHTTCGSTTGNPMSQAACTGICTPWQFSGSDTASGSRWTGAIAVGFLAGAFTDWVHMSHSFDGLYGFPFFYATWLVPLITGFLVSRAILCFVTGIRLLRRAPWARTLAIITAFLAIIHPFTGTLLGIYTLWVLLPSASGQEYEQLVVA